MIVTEPSPDLLHLLELLTSFAELKGRRLPECTPLEGHDLPEPYRTLLVHRGDMTSRLETHFSAPMILRVLHQENGENICRREVLLCTEDTHQPVEYGAIEIDFTAFPDALRSEILAGRQPLGGLLNAHGMRYSGEPQAFLRIAPDAYLQELFELAEAQVLFGRCNVLRGADGRIFARIVEILRP